jgi:phosphoribosylglycinamide formyltransferase 1
MTKQRVAIFASGTGSNAINLIRFFKDHESIEIAFVLSNNEDAPVLKSAKELGVPVMYYPNGVVARGDFLAGVCNDNTVDWIILAGYLRLIPGSLVDIFEDKIINLHPALLPNYGGKGMHGQKVHEAVLANREEESGITIHFVNREFDKGRIIAQFRCSIDTTDTVEVLENKIRYLEHSYLPVVVQNTILQ